jgi:predicted dehydrogenase
LRIGLIGYGNFAKSTLIPSIQVIPNAQLLGICSSKVQLFDQIQSNLNDAMVTNNAPELIESNEIDSVIIATRHANHAELVIKCLENNKHVYVEKPLCINAMQLEEIRKAYAKTSSLIARVGFNRPFSASIRFLMSQIIASRGSSGTPLPLTLNYVVNAKKVDSSSWLHHDGGRLIGEYCHMLDLVFSLIDKHPNACSSIKRTFADQPSDCIQSIFRFSDNSLASISYSTDSSPSLDKEILTVNSNGKTYILNDFNKLQIYDGQTHATHKFTGKGHKECLSSFVDSCLGSLPHSHHIFDEQIATFDCLFKLI